MIEPLSQAERDSILKSMTQVQVDTINEQKKYKIKSEFLNKNYLKGSNWELVDYKTDPNMHLKCDCGRSLKYQFILKDTVTNKQIKLGITHFKQHAEVNDKTANKIKQGALLVNLTIDEILTSYQDGKRFPEELFNDVTDIDMLPPAMLGRIIQFRKADLPLYLDDYFELRRFIPTKMNALQMGVWPKFNTETQTDPYNRTLDEQAEKQLKVAKECFIDCFEHEETAEDEYGISIEDMDYLMIAYFIAKGGHGSHVYFESIVGFVNNMKRKYSFGETTSDEIIGEKTNRVVKILLHLNKLSHMKTWYVYNGN